MSTEVKLYALIDNYADEYLGGAEEDNDAYIKLNKVFNSSPKLRTDIK